MPLLNRIRSKISKPKSKNVSDGSDSRLCRSEKNKPENIVRSFFNLGVKNKTSVVSVAAKNPKMLSRSDTFTMNESTRTLPSSYYSNDRTNDRKTTNDACNSNSNTFTKKKGSNIKTDVFETLYTKRPSKSSKSSRSSKSSSESVWGYHNLKDNSSKTVKPSYFDSNTFRKPSSSKENAPPLKNILKNSRIPIKPRPYLFGTIERPQKNVVINYDNNENNIYRTITLNKARRSFRESFLQNSKPDAGKEYQPVWFIDVNDDKNKKIDFCDDAYENKPRNPVSRKNTFKVEHTSLDYSNMNNETLQESSLKRKDTFKVDRSSVNTSKSFSRSDSLGRSRKYLEPTRGEMKSSISDRHGKVVPIGVTAPYSALNDVRENIARYGGRNESDKYKSIEKKNNNVKNTSSLNYDQYRSKNIKKTSKQDFDSLNSKDKKKSNFVSKIDNNRSLRLDHDDVTPSKNIAFRDDTKKSSGTKNNARSLPTRKFEYVTKQFEVKLVSPFQKQFSSRDIQKREKNVKKKSVDWMYNKVYI